MFFKTKKSRPTSSSWPPGKRNVAVENSATVALGIGFFPNAMPTTAVMCVSGPKTWTGIPKLAPTSLITLKITSIKNL